MKIINNNPSSPNCTHPSSVSLKDRIKIMILPFFNRYRVDEKFERKFAENLTITTRANNFNLLKKAIRLHKRFPQDKVISRTYKTLINQREQLFNKASKSVRTPEQAMKAVEIINNRIHNIDRITEQQMEEYPDEINEIIEEGTRLKAFLYSVRDKIDAKHLAPVHKNSPQLRFNLTPKVHTFRVGTSK